MKIINSIKRIFSETYLAHVATLLVIFDLLVLFFGGSNLLFYPIKVFLFVFLMIVPGLLILSIVTAKKVPFILGVTLSVALSIFSMMFFGLLLNMIFPLFGYYPLTQIPILGLTNFIIIGLLFINHSLKRENPIELPRLNFISRIMLLCWFIILNFVYLGSVSLNNGGSDLLNMVVYAWIFFVVVFLFFKREVLDEEIYPLSVYLIALCLLLMNTLRGLYVTGHDILLEQHVFLLTNSAHIWSMKLYRDPYNACLSLTILPTYIQNILNIDNSYILKLLFQFLGSFVGVIVYFLTKKYTKHFNAFVASFVFITFPTYMVDMAFLNRQGLAFLFFALVIFVAFNEELFRKNTKLFLMFIFGIGMIFSHYSTSYIAVAMFIGTYVINLIFKYLVRIGWPHQIVSRIKNIEVYKAPAMIPLTFVVGIFACMIFWSTVVTKTSDSLFHTIREIAQNITQPFGKDQFWGPAKYSLINSKAATSQELFDKYVKKTIEKVYEQKDLSNHYLNEDLSKYVSYPAYEHGEPVLPLNKIGEFINNQLGLDLNFIYALFKQLYAKSIQIFLLIGLIGLYFGDKFRDEIKESIPSDYLALCFAGMSLIVAQTILPASAIDYGLLRLFQQNLIFLSLPILCGIMAVISWVVRRHSLKMYFVIGVLSVFYLVLSGFIPQITGGSRPYLALNNYGFYYDTYYTHSEEVSAIRWLSMNTKENDQIQSDHYFSNIKVLTYANISTKIGLLPQQIERDSFVYLNKNNVVTGTVVEYIDGDVLYYHFPIEFFNSHKNLIYNNGGSEIFR